MAGIIYYFDASPLGVNSFLVIDSPIVVAMRLAIYNSGGVIAAAKKLGVNRSVIYSWLRGTKPSTKNIIKIANLVGVDPELLGEP